MGFWDVALGILTGGASTALSGGLFNAGNSVPGGAFFKKNFGEGATDFEQKQADLQWRAYREQMNREEQWRNQDLAREQKWRSEDLERSSLQHRMGEAKAAGLHTSTVLGATGGGSIGGHRTMQTQPGGRIPRPSAPGGGSSSPMEMMAMGSQMALDRSMNAEILANIRNQRATTDANVGVMNSQARLTNAEAELIERHGMRRMEEEINESISRQTSSNITDSMNRAITSEIIYNLERSREMGVRTGTDDIQDMVYEGVLKVLKDEGLSEREARTEAERVSRNFSLTDLGEGVLRFFTRGR